MDFLIEPALIPVIPNTEQDQRCYLPIFEHSKEDEDDIWYLGSILPNKNYFVFDMTPLTEHD